VTGPRADSYQFGRAGRRRYATSAVAQRAVEAFNRRPTLLQTLFISMYAGLWFLGLVEVPGIGRPEKLLIFLGLSAAPVAVGCGRRVPQPLVAASAAGLLVTYTFAFLINERNPEGPAFVLSLFGRLLFLWVSYVLMQNVAMLKRALWLLVISSIFASAVAFVVMAVYEVGIGRLHPLDLPELLNPFTLSTFASAQLAPIGAILLLGAAPTFRSRPARILALVGTVFIFAVVYLSYFRREQLVTTPLILVTMLASTKRRNSILPTVILATACFAAVVVWDYSRDESVIRLRFESELGGQIIDPEETRMTNFRGELRAIAARPIAGFGAANHAAAIETFLLPGERFLGGFNILGWLAVEGGLQSVFFYVLLLVATWRTVWPHRTAPDSSAAAIILRSSPALLLQIGLWGMFTNSWDVPLGWFVLGMMLSAVRVAEAQVALRLGMPVTDDAVWSPALARPEVR
jgi:hypothetical protein